MRREKKGNAEQSRRSSWVSLRPFGKAWAMTRGQWNSVSGSAKTKAGWILGGGTVVCIAWSWAVAEIGAWLEPRGMGDWDERLLGWISEEDVVGFTGGVLFESPGNAAYLLPLTTVVAVALALRGRALGGLAVLVAYWGVRFLVGVGWAAWSRARPESIAEGVAAPGFHSFPSGHTSLAAAAYGMLAYLWIRASHSGWERGFAVVSTSVWVLLVGFARVRLGAHWPSDIPAGLAVALPWVVVVILSLKAMEDGVAQR